MGVAVKRHTLRHNSPTRIADIATAIERGVGIDDFPIGPRLRYADAVAVPRYWGEVAYGNDQEVFRVLRFADEGKHALFSVAVVDPFETARLEIDFMQRGIFAVGAVQIAYQRLHAFMQMIVE